MHNPNKTEASEVNEDANVRTLLDKFTSGEISILEPAYEPKIGYYFPIVQEIIGDISKVESFLEKLVEDKVLIRKLFDKVIYCPHCGSAGISFRYCCPFCKSFNIHKSSLIEHVKCGYMDIEENFRKGAKFACPKCHEDLKRVNLDFRKAGVWCACNDCKKSFDIPVPEHYCTNCNNASTFEEAIIKDVYSYTLGKNVKGPESSKASIVNPIIEILTQAGLKVENPAVIKGKSGAQHSFDIAAFKKDFTQGATVIDLAISHEGNVSEQPIIAMFAKVFDVSPEKAFLIAIPELNENGRKMAEIYNISTIEAKNKTDALALLKEKLSK
jgi:hypothetical protein